MARRAVAASFVLGSLALVVGQGAVTQGCTQDFSTFDGSAGGGTTGTTSSTQTTTTSTSSTSSTNSTTGGGGEGGSGGGPTTTGGGSAQGGGGSGGGCQGASDCDDDNPCTTDVCTDAVCEHPAVADGPIGGTDDPDDCRDHECVDGVESDVADDTEDPVDANAPCVLTVCEGGAPVPDNADAGTSCGPDPLECDGEGTCVGCDPEGPNSQCGAVTECSSPTCEDDGSCAPGFLDDTEVLPDPTPGDCQKDECTGSAVAAVSVEDNGDVPDDLPCATASCADGAPAFARLDEGDACLVGTGVCDGAGNLAANCKACRDTVSGAGTDAGCTSTNPICDEGDGAGVCRHCNDSAGGPATDLGCTDTDQVCDPAGIGTCVDCYTDDGDVVVNCSGVEVCEPTGVGDCRTCYSLGEGVEDAGCSGVTPACDEGADTCFECQDDADCADSPRGTTCSNGSGTLCGCNIADDCTDSNRGIVCRNGAGDDFCGCNNFPADCAGITGATACAGNVCMCGANPC